MYYQSDMMIKNARHYTEVKFSTNLKSKAKPAKIAFSRRFYSLLLSVTFLSEAQSLATPCNGINYVTWTSSESSQE